MRVRIKVETFFFTERTIRIVYKDERTGSWVFSRLAGKM